MAKTAVASDDHDKPCPNCGYCPTCGRARQQWISPYPVPVPVPYPVYPPVYPRWYAGGVIGGVSGGTVTSYGTNTLRAVS